MMLNLLRAQWKRALTMMIWTVVGLNVVYFIQREMMSSSCSVDDIIRRHQTTDVINVFTFSISVTF